MFTDLAKAVAAETDPLARAMLEDGLIAAKPERAVLCLASTREESLSMAQDRIAEVEAEGWRFKKMTARRDGGVVLEFEANDGL